MNLKTAKYERKSFGWETKAISEAGQFTGYGSVFGVLDSYDEIVAPGAFMDTLSGLKQTGRTLPVLWQHATNDPIGNWPNLEEDVVGLQGQGDLWLGVAANAAVAQKGMQTKSVTGLSIGYYVLKSTYDEPSGIRTLNAVELLEVSVVTNPSNSAARVNAVKARIDAGDFLTVREFEDLLREQGFSKNVAAQIAERGYKSFAAGDRADNTAAELLSLLNSFKV